MNDNTAPSTRAVHGDGRHPFSFSTKASTLSALAGHVTDAVFCEQEIISKADWLSDADGAVERIAARFAGTTLAVRSSAGSEDQMGDSMAGAHLSLTHVAADPPTVRDAVARVFDSYRTPHDNDQVLVQPMVTDVALAGVVLTRELDAGGPYYVINYDDTTGRTDTVTGGAESKTVLVHRSRPGALRSARLRKLIGCVIEIERLTHSETLDIEFCITNDENVYVLQVRPLAAQHKWLPMADGILDAAIDNVRARVARHLERDSKLAGATTILAEMTDWNPAEMIGATPRPLSLSLYKSLITDGVWARARDLMGYRFVDGPLLLDFHGRPYIDVRRSFNSFLPAGLDPDLCERLVNYQIATLTENPDLHDKVEFEVATTVRDFAFDRDRARLKNAGFSDRDTDMLEEHLGALTRDAVENGKRNIATLVERSNGLLGNAGAGSGESLSADIGALLDNCREHGTLPFAQLARHGFIAVLFLKSLVHRGVFTQDDMDHFMRTIHTVAADVIQDMHAAKTGAISIDTFLERYGHLRPGTYDILSWRYDERPDVFLGRSVHEQAPAPEPFSLSRAQHDGIEALLAEHGIVMTADGLLDYMADAIRGREQAKFAFSRAISDALRLIVQWGENIGLTRDDLSFLPIEAILANAPLEDLRQMIADGREGFAVTRAIRLPHLIAQPDDIDIVRMPIGHPTFITAKAVTGPVKLLDAGEAPDIDGHIVMIEGADPGFDWIFSYDILGLITMFGGANSHMAIRCAEFGLPAALGCGERLFETLAKSPVVELNCANRRLTGH